MEQIEDIYEFDDLKAFTKAWQHPERFHTCEKSKNKVLVFIYEKGHHICRWCKKKVNVPYIKKELFIESLNQKFGGGIEGI